MGTDGSSSSHGVHMESSRQVEELAWARRPIAELIRLAWPIAVSMISVSVMTLADTMFVGWLGAPSLAGVGLGGTAAFVVLCFPWGLMSGAKVLVSQAVGAGRRDEVGSYLGGALIWAVLIGILLAAGGMLFGSHLGALASTLEAGSAAASYFSLRVVITPVFLVGVALRETRYGLGDSRSPMMASVIANVLNIVLDYVLIFPCGLGVAGAALATVIAQSVETFILFGTQIREGMSIWRTRWRHAVAVWKLGWPSAVQWMMEMGAFSALAVMISMYSEVEMAAHQIVLQIIHFSFLPAVAIHSATSVLCGQAVGAGRRDLVRVVSRRALAVAGVYMASFALALALGGSYAVRGFSSDPAVLEAAWSLIRIAIVFQVFDAANIVARGALQGTGDVRFAAMVGVALSWVSTPPLMWLLGYRLGMGAAGGWMGLSIEIIVGAGIFWWRLERGGWHRAADRATSLATTTRIEPVLG